LSYRCAGYTAHPTLEDEVAILQADRPHRQVQLAARQHIAALADHAADPPSMVNERSNKHLTIIHVPICVSPHYGCAAVVVGYAMVLLLNLHAQSTMAALRMLGSICCLRRREI